jgi:hypothetical protein
MSSVRGCDKCGRIFFENEENWSTGSGTQFYTDDRGKRQSREVQEDRCGTCNGTPVTVQPNLGKEAPSRTLELENQELFARIQNLEANLPSKTVTLQATLDDMRH